MYVDGDWIKAQGTTLGADNGLGVATIMALLESKNISHPKIEALFTIDEETGMTGAINLSETILTGNIFFIQTDIAYSLEAKESNLIDFIASKISNVF